MATLALMDVSTSIEKIDNQSRLVVHLLGLPYEEAVVTAHSLAFRASLRTLPLILADHGFWNFSSGRSALPLLRALLLLELRWGLRGPEVSLRANLDVNALGTNAASKDAGFAIADATMSLVVQREKPNKKLEDAASSVANAREAAMAISDHDLWTDLRDDLLELHNGNDLAQYPLWRPAAPAEFNATKTQAKQWRHESASRLVSDTQSFGDWTFWIDWYEAHLAGTPLPVELLEKIIALPEDIWTNNPAELNRQVMEIYAAWKSSRASASQPQELLQAAIFDFDYDFVEQIMFAVPFEEDWRELTDEERLAAMLKDLASFRKKMELLCKSLEREGTRLQGGGVLLTYLEAILSEFEQASEVGKLLVGEIAEHRRVLENAARDGQMQQELGVLAAPFDDVMEKLTDLLHRHFASTLARFTPLRELELERDADPWEVLSAFRDTLVSMRTGADGKIPALREKDAAVFDNLLDDLERLIREQSRSTDPKQVSSLQREINFAMSKVVVSMTLFAENSYKALPKFSKGAQTASDVAGKVIKAERNANGIAELLGRLKDYL